MLLAPWWLPPSSTVRARAAARHRSVPAAAGVRDVLAGHRRRRRRPAALATASVKGLLALLPSAARVLTLAWVVAAVAAVVLAGLVPGQHPDHGRADLAWR
ncbi:MAG: hypothetical protein R2734_05280 [Nocardioides sp.]